MIGHVTWWPETLAEQTNIMLDVQPTTGHRVLMQSYPGGIQSGTDWYQNDLGVVLTETTIDQSPFNAQGTPVAYRARKSIQYGDSIDKVVELLKTRNNGLYTNEWIIGDARSNEIAMLELGTYKTQAVPQLRKTNGSAARKVSTGAATMPRIWTCASNMCPIRTARRAICRSCRRARRQVAGDVSGAQRLDRRIVRGAGVPHRALVSTSTMDARSRRRKWRRR